MQPKEFRPISSERLNSLPCNACQVPIVRSQYIWRFSQSTWRSAICGHFLTHSGGHYRLPQVPGSLVVGAEYFETLSAEKQ